MTAVIGNEINLLLKKLSGAVESHNRMGNVYGLFVHHILSNFSGLGIEWQVTCDSGWLGSFDEKNVHHVACLGYSLYSQDIDIETGKTFIKAFDLLKERETFKGTHVSFPYQCSTFLGLVLGTKTIQDENWRKSTLEWLKKVLEKRLKLGDISSFLDLFYKYIAYHISDKPVEIRDISPYSSLEDMSFLVHLMIKNIFKTPNQHEDLICLRKDMLKELIGSGVEGITGEKACVIYAAVQESIAKDIDNFLISPNFVCAILYRFEDAMKRWRYDSDELQKPVKWPINEEREVQDILWLVLRSYFDDLVDEETLPKVGHSSYKPDFAIPSLRLLIEAKATYSKADFKKVEKEIMVDTKGYLLNTKDYDKIIVFIYDKSASVQEHGTTRKDLKKMAEIEDIIIVSKPSQLP